MMLGLSRKDWEIVYRLYVHEKEAHPKDMWKLHEFWIKLIPGTPDDCMKIALKMVASEGIDVSPFTKMFTDMVKGLVE